MKVSFSGKVIALSAGIVLLAGAYLAGSLDDARARGGAGRPLFPRLDPAQVASIEVGMGGVERARLTREAGGWSVRVGREELPASTLRVSGLIAALRDLRSAKVMSTEGALLPTFGLVAGEEGRIVVRSSDGSVLAEIEVGKQAPSGYEDYLRLPGSQVVYLAPSSLRFYLANGREYWYDLSLLPDELTGSTITSMEVRGSVPLADRGSVESSYRLTRSTPSGRWRLDDSAATVDQTLAAVMVNSLATLQAVDFVLDLGALVPGGEVVRIEAGSSSGRSIAIEARSIRGGGRFVVTRSDRPFLYLVNREALRRAVLPEELLIAGAR